MERNDFEQWKAREVARLLALVETERRYYQEMVASLPVALVVLSADRSVISANRAFRRTFGVRSDDLRRKTIEQIIPAPRLIERIREAHMHAVAQPDLYVDVPFDSGERTLRIAIVPMRNWDDESEVETLLMVEDLRAIAGMLTKMGFATAQPAGEVATAVANEVAIESAGPEAAAVQPAEPSIPAVLWRADAATFRFLSVSGAAEPLLGYPASHWLESAQFFSERIHPDDRPSTMALYEAAAARPGDASAEYRALSASGAIVWCRETIRVPEPRESGGEPRWITGVITDISVRRQLEQQMLTGERRDALRTLSSRLAHDLNNPLMIIAGYSEEMLETLTPEDPRRDDVAHILGATERISGITGQLLGFTRRLAAPAQPVDLGRLVAGMQEKIAEAAGEGVTVEIVTANEAAWGAGDPEQLEQIVLALVSSTGENAQERSRVTIGCEIDAVAEQVPGATLKPGLYARMLIHDNGGGADAARRMTIFESALAGKDSEKSAGPALARAYAIVREWEGDIAFSSEPLRGSTFMLYLPYAPPEPPPIEIPLESAGPGAASETPVEPTPAPVEAPAEPPRETILLVEDEAGIRALVRKILRRERYVVIEAGSGEEALAIAQSHGGPIHLLVTDVMLPEIGGRNLAGALTGSNPELKVLYISGYTDDEGVRAGWFPPGSRFLQKPFTLSALVGKVREALDAE